MKRTNDLTPNNFDNTHVDQTSLQNASNFATLIDPSLQQFLIQHQYIAQQSIPNSIPLTNFSLPNITPQYSVPLNYSTQNYLPQIINLDTSQLNYIQPYSTPPNVIPENYIQLNATNKNPTHPSGSQTINNSEKEQVQTAEPVDNNTSAGNQLNNAANSS